MSLLINQQSPDPKWRAWVLVTVLVLALVCLCVLQGCVTEKQRQKICRNCPSTNTITVTKKDSVSSTDSSFYNEGKSGGDVVLNFSTDTVFSQSTCDSIKKALAYLKAHPYSKKVNGITTTIGSNGKNFIANCKYDSLLNIIKKYREREFVEIETNKESKIITNDCPETWIQQAYRYSAWFLYACIVIVTGGAITHLYFKKK